MVIVLVREDVALLAATEYETVPLPEPLAPPVTVIQPTLLAAVHAQPEPAVTVTVPLPAVDDRELLVGVMAYVHAPPFGS